LLACAVAAAGLTIGLRAGTSQQPDDASRALAALVERSGTALVYSEFGDSADTIWATNPSDPDDHLALGIAPHDAGYGVFPALSPDGRFVAYTALSGGRGELRLLDIKAQSTRTLAAGVDLQATPVWSNDSASVVVRRSSGGDENAPIESELLQVDLNGTTTTIVDEQAGVYAIDFSPEGALYYASLNASGTTLKRAGAAGIEDVALLSNDIARDWTISPDGARLAYAASGDAGFAVSVLDIATGESGTAGSSSGAGFSPVWAPDGTLSIGNEDRTFGAGGAASSGGSGFDMPVSWASDGSYFVVRHFEGESAADPGPSWLWAIDATGSRQRIADTSDIVVAGWLEASP
jgi:hypothetical protein